MKKIILVCALIFTAVAVCQSNGSVRGQITDKESFGEPLFYADVELKNKGARTQTNLHGNFEISNLVPGSYTLVIRYLGYEPKEVPFLVKKNITTEINAELSAKTLNIDLGTLISENPEVIEDLPVLSREEKE